MTEQQQLHGLLLISAMQETLKKVEADFSKLRKAADDFRRDFEAYQRARRDEWKPWPAAED
jgi:hypothetical protein